MKTDWSLPPETLKWKHFFSFCNSCHFVRLKTLFRGLFLSKSPFKAQMLTFILYVQSYDSYDDDDDDDDQSFNFVFQIVSSRQFFFLFFLYMLYRQLCLYGVSCLGICT